MKFAHLLEMNMVPEWRNQYIDYKRLDAALSKAIEQKDRGRKADRGIDSYFHLIKSNQKFANYFSKECKSELDKINAFHREKLHEMKGKHDNLQDQLEQVLSSAIYTELNPQLSSGSSNCGSPSSIKSASHSLVRGWRRADHKYQNRNTHSNSSTPQQPTKSSQTGGFIRRGASINDLVSTVKGQVRRSLHTLSPGHLLSTSSHSASMVGPRSKSSSQLPSVSAHHDNFQSLVQHQFDLYNVEQGSNLRLYNSRLQDLEYSDEGQITQESNNETFKQNQDDITRIYISPPGSPTPPMNDPQNNRLSLNDCNNELSNDAIKSMARKLSASLSVNDNNVHHYSTNSLPRQNNTQLGTNNNSNNNDNHNAADALSGSSANLGPSSSNQFFENLVTNYSPKMWNKGNRHLHQRYSSSLISLPRNSTSSLNTKTCPSPDVAAFNGATNSAQSKKQIIAFHKSKISNLKFAFQELYLNLVLFEQYTQLNYAAFEQILRKHDRMFASSLGRKFYQEHVQTADFYNDLQLIDQLIESVEHIYTLNFEDGNRRKAIEKLSVPPNVYKPSSPMLDFRVGFELGCSAILFILVFLIGLWRDRPYDWRTVFRLYRSPLLLIIFLFQTGISLIIWNHYKINHVLIFELNPRNKLSFQHFLEFASLLGVIWSLSVLAFLFSEQLNIPPALCPLFVVMLVGIYLFNPMAFLHHKARFWLLRIMTRILRAPFHGPVKFADFWIADQLVSIVPLFLDLEYLSCFYISGDEVLSVTKLTSEHVKRCVTRNPQDLVIRTLVAALPAWFRCAQCLRRWHDENWLRFHLANALKYGCMVMTVVLSSIAQYNAQSFELDTMRCIWLAAAIFTSSLTAYWDIIYDFGLFNTYDNDDKDKKPRVDTRGSIVTNMNPQIHVDSSTTFDEADSSNQGPNDSSNEGFELYDDKSKSQGTNSSFKQKLSWTTTNPIGKTSKPINKSSISSDATYKDLFSEGAKKAKTYRFLRKQLVYPFWVYYFAIVENWILRFGWIFTISLTEFSGIEAGLVVSILAPLEMFRRFVWNCIRLENEQLNNCGLFRAVRDIPIEVVAPIDESQLDKVIMMMDSRDGPSMRSRLMKRRALRPDSVSFMVLNSSDEIA